MGGGGDEGVFKIGGEKDACAGEASKKPVKGVRGSNIGGEIHSARKRVVGRGGICTPRRGEGKRRETWASRGEDQDYLEKHASHTTERAPFKNSTTKMQMIGRELGFVGQHVPKREWLGTICGGPTAGKKRSYSGLIKKRKKNATWGTSGEEIAGRARRNNRYPISSKVFLGSSGSGRGIS